MKRVVYAIALLAATLAVSCNRSGIPEEFNYKVKPAKLGVSSEKIAALDDVLHGFVDQEKVSCATAFIAKGGNVIYEKSFGFKDLENKVPACPDDIYVLYSQTKAIVAVALMTLYEQGKFEIDDPISKYIPGFTDEVLTFVGDDGTYTTVPAERPVTVGHLMCHSSGYLAPLTNKLNRILSASGERPFAPRTTVGASVEANKTLPLGFQPGTEWNYNYDMDVIAYLVEILSGKTLQEYLKEALFIPLGMDYTAYYFDDESLKERIVNTYSKQDGKFVKFSMSSIDNLFNGPKTYAGGTFGLYGPIQDYAKFCQMLVNGGEFNNHRILKPETIQLMLQNRLPEVNSGGKGFRFGLGFELFTHPDKEKIAPQMSDSCFRWGGAAGTEYLMDPENDLVILYYISMWGDTGTYPVFLKAAYDLFE
ncbi:MAG: beta-lactamase family protein [Bacteroidales bacterium]|nr:beta-lactamase family protein [Bacteroidales bacterium]